MKIVALAGVYKLPETTALALPAPGSVTSPEASLPTESFVPQQQTLPVLQEKPAKPGGESAPASPAPGAPDKAAPRRSDDGSEWKISDPKSPDKSKDGPRFPGDGSDDGPGLGGGYFRVASSPAQGWSKPEYRYVIDDSVDGTDGPSLGGGYFTGPVNLDTQTSAEYCDLTFHDFACADGSSTSPACPAPAPGSTPTPRPVAGLLEYLPEPSGSNSIELKK